MANALVRDAALQAAAASKRGMLERVFARMFEGLVYAQTWEDPEVDLAALEIGPTSRVVTIASGGCNVMSCLVADPASILAVDPNPAHVALLKLKLAAARHLPHHEAFHSFFADAGTAEKLRLSGWARSQARRSSTSAAAPAATWRCSGSATRRRACSASTRPSRCSRSRRRGCDARVRAELARGVAEELDPASLFGHRGGFDHVTISYCLSMVDDPERAVRTALRCLAPAGTLHVVDFGDMAGLPGWFRRGMTAWLARFGVRHRPEVEAELHRLATTGDVLVERQLVAKSYAVLLRLRVA